MRRPQITLSLSLLALASVLVACGGDSTAGHGGHGGGGPSSSRPGEEQMADHDGSGGMDHDHREASPVVDGARRIPVAATSFAFEPDEITVTAGEDVAIVLTSDDVLHDLTIDELDAHVAADEGQTAEGGLRADEPGEYTFYCSVSGHRDAGMEGTLVVEEP